MTEKTTMNEQREKLVSELEEWKETEAAIKARLGDARRELAALLETRRSVAVEAVQGDEESLSVALEVEADLVEARRMEALAEEALRVIAPRAAILKNQIQEIDLEEEQRAHEEAHRHSEAVRLASGASWETISPAATASSTLRDPEGRRLVYERALNSAKVAAPDLSEEIIFSIVDQQMQEAMGEGSPVSTRPSYWSEADGGVGR